VNSRLAQRLTALLSGGLFGVGLLVSGMTQPQKVIDFLDVFGQFDASLMFVMGGAIGVHVFAYRWQKHRTQPLFDRQFYLPARTVIDSKLVLGASLFGVGWGLGGYCPGPAVVSLPAGNVTLFAFVFAMLAGMFITAKLETLLSQRKQQLLVAPHEPSES